MFLFKITVVYIINIFSFNDFVTQRLSISCFQRLWPEDVILNILGQGAWYFNSRPEGVHVGVDDDEDEGDDEVEDQPDVHHLDVGCYW